VSDAMKYEAETKGGKIEKERNFIKSRRELKFERYMRKQHGT